MVLERFLSWLNAAPAQARADAAHALVAAYSRLEGDTIRRGYVDRVVAVLLDDPVALVRRALAEAAAHSAEVPRHVIVALSRDVSPVSAPVLRASRVLTAADLVEALKVADAAAQLAVAGRPDLPATVSALLAEEADAAAVLALCRNGAAPLAPDASRRIVARFGREGAIREALLARDDLAATLRLELAFATARALTGFAVACEWMSARRAEGVIRESTERAAVTIAAAQPRREAGRHLRPFVAALRTDGRLTPALLLRSLATGETGLFEAALGELARVPPDRVTGAAGAPSGLAFAALYARAGLPRKLLPAFQAALAAANRAAHVPAGEAAPRVMPAVIARMRAALRDRAGQPALGALLVQLEAEGVRDGMRVWRRTAAAVPAIPAQAEAPVWMLPRPTFRLPSRAAA